MSIVRITSGNSKAAIAYEIEYSSNDKVTTSKADLALLPTQSALEADLASKKPQAETTPIFLHKNKAGTIAVATGSAPKVWPEDEK